MTAIAMKEITGKHVLIGICTFFGIMLLANGIFLYFALSTFNGLQSPTAYQDGVHYNDRIDAARRQAALGWLHAVALEGGERLDIRLSEKDGEPVSGLLMSGTITRPVNQDATQSLTFREVEPGLYRAEPNALQPGSWIVSAEAAKSHAAGREVAYRLKERLWLKPTP